jgi:tRNA pseudouridine55 synthase
MMKEDQIILVDKPAGMTSFGVVARIRRLLSDRLGKKAKVGHTGTLDPFATGLMIIVTGKECKNAEKYSKLDKVYEATIRLGQTSSTGDPEGEITEVDDRQPTKEEVSLVLQKFQGEIQQRPPIYSAIKVISIHNLELVDYTYPELKIRTHVSSGTYIRTLAEDIGTDLKTGAYCTQLRRTAVSSWSIEEAKQLSDFGITN